MPYNHIHEIIPKSKTKDWDVIENRVPLCAKDHFLVHQAGASNSAPMLREYQLKRLLEYYGDSG